VHHSTAQHSRFVGAGHCATLTASTAGHSSNLLRSIASSGRRDPMRLPGWLTLSATASSTAPGCHLLHSLRGSAIPVFACSGLLCSQGCLWQQAPRPLQDNPSCSWCASQCGAVWPVLAGSVAACVDHPGNGGGRAAGLICPSGENKLADPLCNCPYYCCCCCCAAA
jgi:hypothetical protein